MDVRCDRCQTEYDLEDESVTDSGASVQCTSCGHTFVVSRANAGPRASATPTPSPTMTDPAASTGWMLNTEEGKTHRFRDPTTLQKWIVERRVGRNDRVCPPGGSWRRLGDMDDLRPFFEVVEQADRAAAAASAVTRVARPTRPETPGRRSMAPAATYTSHDADDDDVLSNGDRHRPGIRPAPSLAQDHAARPSQIDSEVTAAISGPDDDDAISLRPPRKGLKVFAGVVILGLAGVAAYLGSNAGSPSPPKEVASALPPAPPPASAPKAAVPAAPPPAAPPKAAPPKEVASAPAVASAPKAAVPAAPSPAAEANDRGATRTAAPSEPARGRSYEQLVADGDRALVNGNTAKAQKLFDEALKLQPDGVAAVTGSGYLALDRQKPLAAIGMFKRALSSAPEFPQALFGLAEAYRAQGDTVNALDAYRNYLSAAPGGSESPAARRQIRELEEQRSSNRHAVTAPSDEQPTPSAE